MLTVSEEQVLQRIRFENPWWKTKRIDEYYDAMRPRKYFDLFLPIVEETSIKRATILMGPRRVGKTVMLFHLVQHLINTGVPAERIVYLALDTPLYNGIGLDYLFALARQAVGADKHKGFTVIFDEIQYLKNWESHLKSLVDSYHGVKFIASGSAAAALKLKSAESGAGRFTEFILPPLNFYEYLCLQDLDDLVEYEEVQKNGADSFNSTVPDIDVLNQHFVRYINFGGYPEVIFSPQMQENPERYIRNDIIDKVLLRDLPSLYGIEDIQELNALFTTLAYNSGQEISMDSLAQKANGVTKATLKKYLTYLEAAFLIKIVHRIDNTGKYFQRANFFKVYLTNPSLRSALFAPLQKNDEHFGAMVETAVFAQWFHAPNMHSYYARWAKGEVDMVEMDSVKNIPITALEIKWSNRFAESPHELKSLKEFCETNKIKLAVITTIDIRRIDEGAVKYSFIPASQYCYLVGRWILDGKKKMLIPFG
jgi:uncharacterized protein